MQLIEVPAKDGYQWFRRSISLFRRAPLTFLTVFFAYLFALMLLSLPPVIGSVLPLLVIPGASLGFLVAARRVLQKELALPTVLLAGFREYGPLARRRLLVLGVLYVVGISLCFAVSTLVDGGTFANVMLLGGRLNEEEFAAGNFGGAMLATMLAYIPVAALFWFSPVLVAWHDTSVGKALFFSWIAVWRNRGAFVVFGLLWLALALGLSLIITFLIQALNLGGAALTVLMPVSVILTSMLYCSFYITYLAVLRTEAPADAALPGAGAGAGADDSAQ